MIKLKKSDWIAISVFLFTLSIIGSWSIDISVSAILNDGVCTNGIITVTNPLVTYHISLYLILITSFIEILIIIHLSVGDYYDKKK